MKAFQENCNGKFEVLAFKPLHVTTLLMYILLLRCYRYIWVVVAIAIHPHPPQCNSVQLNMNRAFPSLLWTGIGVNSRLEFKENLLHLVYSYLKTPQHFCEFCHCSSALMLIKNIYSFLCTLYYICWMTPIKLEIHCFLNKLIFFDYHTWDSLSR